MGSVGGVIAVSSSLSGLAIRSPPRDCDRLKSPFMSRECGGSE